MTLVRRLHLLALCRLAVQLAQRHCPSPLPAGPGGASTIECFFGRVLVFFRLQRPPVFGWSAVETRVSLTYAAVWVIALAAWQAGRPDLMRSPCLVLAHIWTGMEA